MENYLKPEEIKREFCGVEIKEEVFFELIEEESCIEGINVENGIINDTKEEKVLFDMKQVQSCNSNILKEENQLVNPIKKEDFNNIDFDKDKEIIKEEEEIDYVWPEDAVKETDPLALPQKKYEDEFQNIKEEESVLSVSLSDSSSRKESDSISLKVHEPRGKQFNEERPHKTKECHLKQQLRIHTGERLYKCNICAYASSQIILIKIHMKKHTGEKQKPFKCNVCDYASSRSNCLIRHMRSHTGERPFKCNVCDYASSYKSNLKTHMKSHTADIKHMGSHKVERQFKCNVCNYASSYSSNLKTHMRSHTGERPFKCNVCEYASSRAFCLKRHMKKHIDVK